MRQSLLYLLPLLLAAPGAQALSIDFGAGPDEPTICSSTADGLGSVGVCAAWAYLSQSYGDVAGVVDVTYSAPRIVDPTSLEWWPAGYNNLYGVAFAPGGDADSQARIEIKALQPGDAVTLTGLELGAYPSTTRDTTLNIYAIGGGAALFTYSGPVGDGSTSATHFSPNVSAPGGLWIEFADSAYNVGIDNIEYSVGAVPEPATVAMMLAGLAGVGAAMRRRR